VNWKTRTGVNIRLGKFIKNPGEPNLVREILISLGVVVACVVILLAAQFNAPKSEAIAAELITKPTIADIVSNIVVKETKKLMEPIAGKKTVDENLITTASGLQYVELVEGTGAEPIAGQTVVVHYTGTLTDGTKFDSSRDRNQPFSFKIGAGQVIQGWDEGLATMKIGGRRKLVIPAKLGYGDRGVGPIPGGATLLFDVELLKVVP
jgi:peptidylprolyl isomerase